MGSAQIMILHVFKCEKEHIFYLPLNLPQPLETIGKLLTEITCPLCQSKTLTINAKEFKFAATEEGYEEDE
jgi:hypothetical protein